MKVLVLKNIQSREAACAYVREAPEGHEVVIRERKRSEDQSAKFHAICADIAKSGLEWAGKPRTAEQWKVLLVSGHSVATKNGAEIVPGLENEFVNIRESTARMSKARSSSLIEYCLAFCAEHEIRVMNENFAAS